MTAQFEARLLALASDILHAVGTGELAPDAPVVRAAGLALGELRRPAPEPSPTSVTAVEPVARTSPDPGATARGSAAPVEHVLAVAQIMRRERVSFAAACIRRGELVGASAQAVRNACTRWLGATAREWQPVGIEGAADGVEVLLERVLARSPWIRERALQAFGLARTSPSAATHG